MSAPTSLSGERLAFGQGIPGRLIGLTVAILLVRVAAAMLIPLGPDEAYYRAWASAPALGYYDHPPMIAWWIWLGERIAGTGSLGVRLLPILSAAASTFIVFDLARLGGLGECIASRAAIWWNAALLIGFGGFLAVPDAPASLFWTLSLWSALKALGTLGAPGGLRGAARAWWIGAGAAAGLATISKYSGLFLAPGLLLWLACDPKGRRALASPWPWIAAACALAIFSLNLGWNAEHHWESFSRPVGRVAPHRFAPRFLPEIVLGQIGLLNPLIALVLGLSIA
ncbi:MAG: glycosyltransferase family 39 protein, partial [Caulobacteraceae bacterium]